MGLGTQPLYEVPDDLRVETIIKNTVINIGLTVVLSVAKSCL